MAEVINLLDHKKETTLAGQAFCLFCDYEWTATASAGVAVLECPSCGAMKGIFKYLCERDEPHWICNCGNDLFKVTSEGYYCIICGCWQHGF